MGARVTDMGVTRYTVWVNAQEVRPGYADEEQAVARGEREAATHTHVQVTRQTGKTRPRTVAEWRDGKRV